MAAAAIRSSSPNRSAPSMAAAACSQRARAAAALRPSRSKPSRAAWAWAAALRKATASPERRASSRQTPAAVRHRDGISLAPMRPAEISAARASFWSRSRSSSSSIAPSPRVRPSLRDLSPLSLERRRRRSRPNSNMGRLRSPPSQDGTVNKDLTPTQKSRSRKN